MQSTFLSRSGPGALLLAALLLGGVIYLLWPSPPQHAGTPERAGGRPSARQVAARRAPEAPPTDLLAPQPTADPDELAEDRRVLWEKRLDRAQRTLDSYLEATRYPPGSRPIDEHPDLVQPHHVAPVNLPLAREDGKPTDARVTLRQDRFFLVGDERVTLMISCENSDGPALCEVLSAVAAPLTASAAPRLAQPPRAGRAPSASSHVAFRASEGGALTATFQPISQGFADYHGTIRISLALRVESETGGAAFDVQYTPTAPAAFTGAFQEVLEDGSLDLLVEMDVERPGRYVVTARVDDTDGKSFAYLTFNEEVGAGRQAARLRLFGKLIRDLGARSPFRLRDIEGFLLKENTFPDRELMPALLGTAYTTRQYKESDFSDAAWESEEKDRHVNELSKDVEMARQILDGEDP